MHLSRVMARTVQTPPSCLGMLCTMPCATLLGCLEPAMQCHPTHVACCFPCSWTG